MTLKFMMAAALAAALALPATASAFFGWRVAGVAANDVLKVRAYPSSTSKVQAAYVNGTNLSMTGTCTGGLHMDQTWFAKLGWSGKRAAVRYRWCQIWHDPKQNGQFKAGWVYGKYIAPL
jgi:predicted MFS family arabinose efflux permease